VGYMHKTKRDGAPPDKECDRNAEQRAEGDLGGGAKSEKKRENPNIGQEKKEKKKGYSPERTQTKKTSPRVATRGEGVKKKRVSSVRGGF